MKTIVTVGSVTYAMKVKKKLSKQGITVKVIKVDPSKTEKGCAYGIEVGDNDFYTVLSAVREEGIGYSVYTENKR